MSETKKILTHKFTDAHPYLASFLFAVALWLISAFVSIGINVLIRMVIKDYPLETGPAALISAAVFGIIHMANVLSGADVLKTVLQSANAFSSGLADALIYMTTGNIWVNFAIHTLHDFIAFSFDTVAENGLMLRTVTWDSWLDFALAAMLGVYSIVMLCRGDVQKHIMDVWTKKWSADKQ